MVKEKPRQYKAELESFKSFTHRVRDLVQWINYQGQRLGFTTKRAATKAV